MRCIVLFIPFLLAVFFSYGQCGGGTVVFKENFGGNFSSGDVGGPITQASSPYAYNKAGSIEVGEYGLRKKAEGMNNWGDGSDHTKQGGFMMMVRSKPELPLFYEAVVPGVCLSSKQSICFAATSLNKKGASRNALIKVVIRNSVDNALVSQFSTPYLPNNDTLEWKVYAHTYDVPANVKSVRIQFLYETNSPAPDDFAIDDIFVSTPGSSGTSFGIGNIYPTINGRYEYPVFACLNERVTLSVGIPYQGKELQWERILPDLSYESIPGATSIDYVIDAARREDSRFYRLRMADSGNINLIGCTASTLAVGLRVDPEPMIENNGPVCEGQVIYMQVNEGTMVNWTGPNGFTATGPKVTLNPTTLLHSGLYTASVSYPAGCELKRTAQTRIVVNENRIRFSLPADTVLCKGQVLKLDARNPGAMYAWSTGDTAAAIQVQKAGSYQVIAYAGSCIRSANTNVTLADRPQIQLRKDTVLCVGDTLLLEAVAAPGDRFKWSTGDTSARIGVVLKGRYLVQATNACGTGAASVHIGFARCYEELFVPTAFTPNGDGLNDLFQPGADISIRKYRMKIYNRWGFVIFHTGDLSKGWDGRVNRLDQPVGTYIWVIEYTSKTAKQRTIHGIVTLIR